MSQADKILQSLLNMSVYWACWIQKAWVHSSEILQEGEQLLIQSWTRTGFETHLFKNRSVTTDTI